MATRREGPYIAVGRRIQGLREVLEMTQAVLAAKCYVSQPAVSAWERGTKLPSRSAQFRIADALHTTRSAMFREAVETEDQVAS